MGHDLISELLEHPNPAGILREVEASLARERIDRERFRAWLRPDVKAEFINGEIIVHSPALRRHNQAVKYISFLLEAYTSKHDLGEVAIEKALVELERNDFEPDVCFWLKKTALTFNDEMIYYPPPNLVVEVLSKSTEGRDRGFKLSAYEADGVSEYWIVNAKSRSIEQYILVNSSDSQPALKLKSKLSEQDIISSTVIHNLSVPVSAFFNLKMRDEVIKHF